MGQQGGAQQAEEPHDEPVPRPVEADRSRISYARSFARVLPVLLILVGAFYDYFTPMAFTADPLFTAAPLVAAPLFSLPGTVLTGAAALVAVLTIHVRLGIVLEVDAITEVATVATVGVPAELINILVRRTDERLASAHQIAEAAQAGTFREAAEQEAAPAREGTRREGLDACKGFTTAVLAEIPHEGDVVRIVNRGHPPPLLLRADGTLVALAAANPALPLGMGELGIWPDGPSGAPTPC